MKRRLRLGFSLVEVTLALGIVAVCLVSLFALLPVGVTSNRTATSEMAATNIATAIISDLRASATANKVTPLGQTVVFGIPIPFSGTHTLFLAEAGQVSGAVDQDATADANPPPRYRATLFFTAPTGRSATVTRLLITWPALADPAAASTPTKFSDSFEIVTSLDIN